MTLTNPSAAGADGLGVENCGWVHKRAQRGLLTSKGWRGDPHKAHRDLVLQAQVRLGAVKVMFVVGGGFLTGNSEWRERARTPYRDLVLQAQVRSGPTVRSKVMLGVCVCRGWGV